MKCFAFALCLAAVAIPALAQDAPSVPARRRVAVLDFDYNAVQSNVTGLLGAGADIGKGVVTELVSELVRNGTFTVMERSQVDRILNEQNFQQGNRADASSAAKVGKLLGVDAIIIGSIIQFDRQNNKIAFGLKKETKAIVVIDARIVGMRTGEILAVAEGKGEAKRSQLNTDDDKNVAFSRSADAWSVNFANTILGEATRAAVDNVVVELAAAAPKIPETAAAIAALVADVSGDQLIINVGTAGGIRVGAEYAVERPGREIKDPSTGSVLRRATTPVGKIKITSADDRTATGTLTGDAAHIGDCVGQCPAAPVGNPAVPKAPGSAPVAVAGASDPPIAPAPSYAAPASAPVTWRAFTFSGTEHFRYVASTAIGEPQTGFYEIDASPAGSGAVQLQFKGQLGDKTYSTVAMFAPNQALPMAALAQLGPAMALFSGGSMALGRPWRLGEEWSTPGAGGGLTTKVEATCQYAGVQGLRGVTRQNGVVLMDVCVAPNVGLPLAVTMGSRRSSTTGYVYALQLIQFRP